MTTKVVVGRVGSFGVDAKLIESMFRVRRSQFADRLRWEVGVDREGREFDWYDALGPTYVIAVDDETSECKGCLRLLPTTGPNMLQDIFRETLQCHNFVPSKTVWEISRLAIAEGEGSVAYGFGPTPGSLIRAMLNEAAKIGLTALVGVTTKSVTRLMRQFGLDVEILGVPALIGEARSVAFRLPIGTAMLARVGVELPRLAA